MKKRARPTKFGECRAIPEPCPWVSCKYHLLWEKKAVVRSHMNMSSGEYMMYWKDLEGRSCALKVAEKEQTLQAIGDIFGVSRERVRQIANWRTVAEGALYNLLKSRDYRLILKGYFGCEIKSFETS